MKIICTVLVIFTKYAPDLQYNTYTTPALNIYTNETVHVITDRFMPIVGCRKNCISWLLKKLFLHVRYHVCTGWFDIFVASNSKKGHCTMQHRIFVHESWVKQCYSVINTLCLQFLIRIFVHHLTITKIFKWNLNRIAMLHMKRDKVQGCSVNGHDLHQISFIHILQNSGM